VAASRRPDPERFLIILIYVRCARRATPLANRANGRPAAGRTGMDSHDHERHGDTEIALASLWRSRSRQRGGLPLRPVGEEQGRAAADRRALLWR
jgi:hypothetical protein